MNDRELFKLLQQYNGDDGKLGAFFWVVFIIFCAFVSLMCYFGVSV